MSLRFFIGPWAAFRHRNRARCRSLKSGVAFCGALGFLSLFGVGSARSEMMMREVDHFRFAAFVLGHGKPTIVLESGMGDDHHSWDGVARRLAPCAKVVLYDRLGTGESGPLASTRPVVASDVADRLSTLLQVLGAAPPYVLVGHSLGGFYVQSFARLFPAKVAAVVLIDSASPFEPPGVFASTTPPKPGSTSAAEDAGFSPSVQAMLAGPPFPSVPLIVMAATKHGVSREAETIWQDVQTQTAKLSPKGSLEVVQGSGHYVQSERPDSVVAAISKAAAEAGFNLSACH